MRSGPPPPPWLRAAAFLGALFVLAVWPVAVLGRGEHLTANLYRTAGAVLLALAVWIARFGARRNARGASTPRPWRGLLVAGVLGSLLTTALSAFVPGVGTPWVSGWLVSGVVGGGAVALVSFALQGGSEAASG